MDPCHYAQQLLGCRDPIFYFRKTIVTEADKSVSHRRDANLFLERARGNGPADPVGQRHDLIDADSPSVACVIALIAAHGLEQLAGVFVGLSHP